MQQYTCKICGHFNDNETDVLQHIIDEHAYLLETTFSEDGHVCKVCGIHIYDTEFSEHMKEQHSYFLSSAFIKEESLNY